MISIEKTYQWNACADAIDVSSRCLGRPTRLEKCRHPVIKVDVEGCLHEPRFIVACAEVLNSIRMHLRNEHARKQFERFVGRYPTFLIIKNDDGAKERWTSIVLEEVEAIQTAIEWLEQIIIDGPAPVPSAFVRRAA